MQELFTVKAPRAAYWRVHRARLVHRRQRVGRQQGDRAAARRSSRRPPTCRRRPRCTSSSTSSSSTRTGCPAAYQPVGDQPHGGARRARLAHAARRLEEPSCSDLALRRRRPRSRRRPTRQLRARAARRPAHDGAGPRAPGRLPRTRCARSRQRITPERDRALRARARAREVLPQPARSSTRSTRTSATRPTRSRSSCSTTEAGLLRAVRGVVRGDGARGRRPGPGRGRLPARHAREPTACST